MDIPNELATELLSILEGHIKDLDEISQYFIIQYTYFEKESDKWIMKNLLDVGNEQLSQINICISDNGETSIWVYAENPRYDILKIKDRLDTRNKSISTKDWRCPTKIYAPDLYTNFEPQHYYGKCKTAILALD